MGSVGGHSPADPIRFIVPWRPDGEHRDRLWSFCKSYWQRHAPDISIHTADAPGTFSRGASINRAALGEWDVGVILDADVVADVSQVRAAIATAQRTGRMTLGFEHYAGLTPHMTERVLSGYTGPWDAGVRFRSDFHESSIVVMPRALWDEVGGFDRRFVGWGQDDVAHAQACRVLGGGIERVPGTVWHLWHPQSRERDRSLPNYRAAQALGARYREAVTPEAIRALLDEDQTSMSMDTGRMLAFTRIYRTNAWNGTETRSGPGSTAEATEKLSAWLVAMCQELGIGSVLDAGCGEGTWQPDLPGYIGVDIVRDALLAAQRRRPERSYALLDICADSLPTTDAVLCRDALQHLPLGDALAALQNFRRCGAKYLIASTHRGEINHDVPAGGWYPCNLEAAPFWLGTPAAEVFDGRWAGQDRYPTKLMGVWPLG